MGIINTGKGNAVKKWRAGEPVDHRKLNQMVDQINAMIQGARPPQQIFPSPGDSPPPVIQRLQIVSISGDALVCNPFDGASADTTSEIQVAKPPELRRSHTSWNGMTFIYSTDQARVATSGADTENQSVVPAYVVGDVILAADNIVGGSGVTGMDDTDLGWIDLNLAARAWAKANA